MGTDPVVSVLALVAVVALVVMVGLLVRVGIRGDGGQVRLRIDNQAGLALQLDVDDAAGARMGLGPAPPRAVTTVQVADIGTTWSFVASYGGQAVFRQTLSKTELQRRD